MARILSIALSLAAALAPAAQAGMLYKSIGPNGTVMFSDMPPSGDAKLVEQREIGSPSTAWSSGQGATGLDLAAQLLDADAAVARANAQVDQAEHALAEARRGTWSPRDGLGVEPTRATRNDFERIEYYKRGVKIARQQLIEVLRDRKPS